MKKFLACLLAAVLVVTSVMPTMKAEAATNAVTLAQLEADATTRYNNIMSIMQARIVNGVDGNDISYSSGWYNNLEYIEVAARMIYASAPNWKADKQSVAMVIWNRRATTGYPNSLYDVVVEAGEFEVITGNSTQTAKARAVDITTPAWQNSLKYACYLWSVVTLGGTKANLVDLLDQEVIATGQTSFMMSDDFFDCADYDSDMQESYIVVDGETIGIYNIFIPLIGSCSNVTTAYTLYHLSGNVASGLPYDAEGERSNIFYIEY